MNRMASLLAMLAAALHAPALAQAQHWPQKPVRVLVGLAPGGNPDTLARMLAAKWGDAFGQQFVVENRPGAGSTIAADLTAKSAPDGYTVLISDSSVITTAPHLFKSLPYDPFRDLQAVSLAVVVPMRLVVHPSVPANSVGVFVASRTPREIVARLNGAVSAAVKSPEVVERMAGIGMEPAGTTPEQYEKLLREEYERFESLIRRIGMRLD